jgi:hypothetical protein
VKFYVPSDAAAVTDAAALAQAGKAPDWHCSYCGGDNPSDAKFCGGCGGGSDGTEPRRKVQDIRDAPAQPAQPAAAAAPRSKKWLFAVLGALAVIGVGLWFFFFRTHAETLKVTGHTWERTIEVEKFGPVTEEAWEGEVPVGGRELSRREEVYKTEKVQVGTETVKVGQRDLGNGYFEDIMEDRPVYKDNPIYRDKVRYEIERWKRERTLKQEGKDLAPRWPEVKLGPKEREGPRKQLLKVLFQSKDGDARDWEAKDEAGWTFYQEGKSYKASVRASGGIAELEGPTESPKQP